MSKSFDRKRKWKINLIPQLILEILHFYKFCNLIGQEHTQMSLITFNLNLWNNFTVSLGICQEIFKAYWSFWNTLGMLIHDRPSPIYYFYGSLSTWKKLILCFNSFMKYWTFRNPAIWLLIKIFENKTKHKNFAWHCKGNGKSSITIILLLYFFSGKSNDKIFKKNIKYPIFYVKLPIKNKMPSFPNQN